MTIASTRRQLLKLCGATTLAAAMAGAVSAEGGVALAPASPAPRLPFALTTPVHVGEVALKVRDPALMEKYYRDMLGLEVIERTGTTVTMGAGGAALLHLLHRPEAPFETMESAGLYHTAFLMPTRKDLARWLVHVAMTEVPITGFADHHVSEAVYLTDPEGNGVEVYSDRPAGRWLWVGDTVTMGTDPLNIDDIVAETDTSRDDYDTAPAALRIGHIHLKVGAVGTARQFYQSAVGLSSTRGDERRGAVFLSSGRYHHHVAVNVWQSEGAGLRDANATGLDWFSLTVSDPALLAAQQERLEQAGHAVTTLNAGVETTDPWGTRLRLVRA